MGGDIVRNRFWGMYQSIVYKKNVFEAIRRRAEFWFFLVRVLFALISILSVLAWSISKSMPVLWACLIAGAQVVQSLVSFLPWSNQIRTLKSLLPQLISLIWEIDKDWMRIDNGDLWDEDDVFSLISDYEKRFSELETKYTNDVWFYALKSVKAAAEKETDAYFKIRYSTEKGSDADEQTKTEPDSQETEDCSRQLGGEKVCDTATAAETGKGEERRNEVGSRPSLE